MRVQRIQSDANAKYKRWKKLFDNARMMKKEGATLAEGAHLAQVCLERNVKVSAMLIRDSDSFTDETLSLINGFDQRNVPAYLLEAKLYDQISPVEHGAGLMLEVPIQTPSKQEKLSVDALYLDGVQDPGNIGTLIRSAVAAGIKHIAASPTSAHFWSPKALRAGMGAHFAAHLYDNVAAEDLDNLFEADRLAADARGGKDLFATQNWHTRPVVWMMGAEGPGLSEKALSVAHQRYYIPIEHDCESLNVAAAATVCMFELRRRRLSQK